MKVNTPRLPGRLRDKGLSGNPLPDAASLGTKTGQHPRFPPRGRSRAFHRAIRPQHFNEPSVLAPQVKRFPDEICANVPECGDNTLYSSRPQHCTEPFVRTPQVWLVPAETCWNVPESGFDSPYSLRPQHCTEPPVRTPQVCIQPAETCANVPGGGDDMPK